MIVGFLEEFRGYVGGDGGVRKSDENMEEYIRWFRVLFNLYLFGLKLIVVFFKYVDEGIKDSGSCYVWEIYLNFLFRRMEYKICRLMFVK